MKSNIMIIILAFIVASLVAYLQYIKGSKSSLKQKLLFSTLRFLTVFVLLLLLVNPKLEQKKYSVEKPNLVVLTDNSNSVAYLKQEENISNILNEIKGAGLDERFEVEYYMFDNELNLLDSLDFKGTQSNLDQAFKSLRDLKKDSKAPTILISDGNQTYGADYQFSANQYKQEIYPIVIGDTGPQLDVAIKNLIVNKYAYIDNKFPVEITLQYSGNESVSTDFKIKSGGASVYNENIQFSSQKPIVVVNALLEASRPGVLRYEAVIDSLPLEKNIENNKRLFAIEVIDESTNVTIVSEIVHPDIGLFKKSIESNIQRKVNVVKPNDIQNLNNAQLVILYQPQSSFKLVYEELEKLDKNYFTITGTATDWNFLNTIQKTFKKELVSSNQDYGGGFNRGFNIFQLDDLGFNEFPPLQDSFGEIIINKGRQDIIKQTINGFETENPLLSMFEYSGRREAVLFGENIWRWRAQSYLSTNSFEQFDQFIGKIVQFLASNRKKSRISVDYQPFYYGSNDLRITAQYFDKNYEFDQNAQLIITLKNNANDRTVQFPFVLKNNFFEIDLNTLEPGNFDFTVKAVGKGVQRSGKFEIIPFNVEEQFLSGNVTKLNKVATNSGGKLYTPDNIQELINGLKTDEEYKAIQRSRTSLESPINWKSLLLILIGLLGVEWFVRKYKGLI